MEAVAAALTNEYEKAKKTLQGVDDNIIKLYGRDPIPSDKGFRQQRRVSRPGGNAGGFAAPVAGRLFGEARRIINNPNREPIGGPVGVVRGRPPVRRVSLGNGPRLGNIQSRLGPKRRRPDSGDEDDMSPHKPMIQSAVFVPPVDTPKREDSVAMKTDKKGMARNRRMFGALLGTLQSFQKSTKKDEEREKRRAEVEKKLEEKQKNEEFKLRKDKAALWNERREKQRELRQLEAKMKLVRSFEEWEKIVRDQANFIKTTKGRYHIYYMPKKLLPANERALEDTEDYIEAMVKSRRKKLQEEIDRVMSNPVRRRPGLGPDQNLEDKETSDKSDHSESDSEHSDSEVEEGEVTSGRGVLSTQEGRPMNTLPVKAEKEESMEVKQEVVNGKVLEEAVGDSNDHQQVSNELGDEVEMSDDEVDVPETHVQENQHYQQNESAAGKLEPVDDVTSQHERRQRSSPRRRRSTSLSRSRSTEKRPARRRSNQGLKAPSETSSSSDRSGSGSGSDSGSESGSSSGSESEPENKSKSKYKK